MSWSSKAIDSSAIYITYDFSNPNEAIGLNFLLLLLEDFYILNGFLSSI